MGLAVGFDGQLEQRLFLFREAERRDVEAADGVDLRVGDAQFLDGGAVERDAGIALVDLGEGDHDGFLEGLAEFAVVDQRDELQVDVHGGLGNGAVGLEQGRYVALAAIGLDAVVEFLALAGHRGDLRQFHIRFHHPLLGSGPIRKHGKETPILRKIGDEYKAHPAVQGARKETSPDSMTQ